MTVKVKGLKELDRKLRDLEKKVARKIVRTALKKGAEPILHASRSNAPVLTGQLVGSLKVKSARGKRGTITYTVATKDGDYKGDEFYGAFQEYGTSEQEAQPFMRPAFDEKKEEAASIVIREVRIGIEAAAKGS